MPAAGPVNIAGRNGFHPRRAAVYGGTAASEGDRPEVTASPSRATPTATRGAARAFALNPIPPLDPRSGVPLYLQLTERFAALIRERHEALVGQALPTEAECMAHFGISRPTVRQAMAQLDTLGLITRARGRGTFVAPMRLDHNLGLAFEDEARAAHRRVSFRVLERRTMPAPPAVREALGLEPRAMAEMVERLRLLDGKVFGHEVRWFPLEVSRRITGRMLERQAVISLLRDALGEAPTRMRLVVRSVPAEPRIARLLGAKRGAPLLESEHVYRLASGTPVLFGFVRFHGDSFQFTTESTIHAAPETER